MDSASRRSNSVTLHRKQNNRLVERSVIVIGALWFLPGEVQHGCQRPHRAPEPLPLAGGGVSPASFVVSRSRSASVHTAKR